MAESSQQEATLYRFRLQIRSAADAVYGKYKPSVEREDARQEAALITVQYLESGVLAGIARKVDNDPNQIDRYFLRELKCDLITWAKRLDLVRQKERQRSPEELTEVRTMLVIEHNPYDEVDCRLSWPTWCMRVFDGMTIPEIAKEENVSTSTIDRRLAEEKKQAKEYRDRRS